MPYVQFEIKEFQGLVDNLPAPNKPAGAFDDMMNFVCRKGRLQTRPRLNNFGAPPDGAIVRNMITFEDVVNKFHTLALTTQHGYYLNAGGTYNLLTNPGSVSAAQFNTTALPFWVANLVNRVYFSNGSATVMYTDGSSSLKTAGDVQGASRYMTVLASRLILGYTTEPAPGVAGSTEQPFRVRWSVSGDPNDWTGFGSGFADILEVPDRITGLATLGRNAYLWRKNGISIISPTGDGLSPFAIENYSNSPKGVGCAYPYGLSVYSNIAAFPSTSDIWSFNGVELQAIGGKSKKRIFADLAAATGDEVQSFIVPNMGLPYDFLSYWLCIPGPNVAWVYSYDDACWQPFDFLGGGRATFVGNVAVT